jgi:hypothetical protein
MNGDSILEAIGTADNIKSKYYGFINHLGLTIYDALNYLGIGEGFTTNLNKVYSLSDNEMKSYKVSPDFLIKFPYSLNTYYRYTVPVINPSYDNGLPLNFSASILSELNNRNSQLVELTEKLLGGVKILKNDGKRFVPYIQLNVSFSAERVIVVDYKNYKTSAFNTKKTIPSGNANIQGSHIFIAEDNRLVERLTESPLYNYVLKYKIITN